MSEPVSKPSPDWIQIEVDYRAGVKPLRVIADEHGITHGAINKRAKKHDWTRSLAAKIRAKAEALVVSKAAVSTEVSTARMVTEKQVVDAAARQAADVLLSHRTDIHRSRALAMKLLDELEQQTDNQDLFEQIVVALAKTGGPDGQQLGPTERRILRDGLDKALSLSNRTGTMKALADSLKTLIGLERAAFHLDDAEDDSNDAAKKFVEAMLHARQRAATK